MAQERVPFDTWTDDQGAHEVHKFSNGWGLSLINEGNALGVLGEPYGNSALLRAVQRGWDIEDTIASGTVPEELSHYFTWDGTGSWKGRAEAAAILAAVESYCEDETGVVITRHQLEAWAGHGLSDEQVQRVSDAIPHSSVPDAIGQIAAEAFSDEYDDE